MSVNHHSNNPSKNQNPPARKKIGFWSVTSLVAGSQIGSGILLLPASLALFGSLSLWAWGVTALGAILLALVFSKLCAEMPKTGGPHVYVEAAFGRTAGFFTAWTYWMISWVSSAAVVVAIIGYLHPVLGDLPPYMQLSLEILALLAIAWLNILGVKAAGYAELFFTFLKVVPLILIPLFGLSKVNLDHFQPINFQHPSSLFTNLSAAVLLTFWGFIGVESATTPAGSVENPSKTIPNAIIFGTLLVAFVYLFSSFVIMGTVPLDKLAHAKAPFAEAAHIIFGGHHWRLIIGVIGSIICIGTLNAWLLTSGQIAMGAAQDGLFPRFFQKTNAHFAPQNSILISTFGMVPILFITLNENLISQFNLIVDVSIAAFVLVYAVCTLSFVKRILSQKRIRTGQLGLGLLALAFCLWALWATGLRTLGLMSLIVLSGLPVFFWQLRSGAFSHTR